MIREKLPATSVAFVSIKPSPSRQRLMPKMREANLLIKKFLKQKKNTAFIDVYHKMLNKDGTPLKDIFLEDELHMNAKGYAIWQKVMQPYLLK
jgi:lysophospholipase L1-like esterase